MVSVKRVAWILILLSTLFTPIFAKPAPTFTLPIDKGGSICLDSLRGKVVYLDFWASWCDPCRKSFPWMETLQKKFGEKGFKVVAVSLDKKREAADDFLEKHPGSFIVAFDPTGTTAQKYEIKAMPSSFLIDRDGNIVSTHQGFREADTDSLQAHIEEIVGK